jgi:hypothetical protein
VRDSSQAAARNSWLTVSHSRRCTLEVRACRTIQKGEEIFISYFDTMIPRAERQEKAKDRGFTCQCEVCTLPAELSSAIDTDFKSFQEATDICNSLVAQEATRESFELFVKTASRKSPISLRLPRVNFQDLFQTLDDSALLGEVKPFKNTGQGLVIYLRLLLGKHVHLSSCVACGSALTSSQR